MYEIWSLGHKPFEVYSNREVCISYRSHCGSFNNNKSDDEIGIIQAAKMVEKGYRLPPPPGCSKELYKVMIRCW